MLTEQQSIEFFTCKNVQYSTKDSETEQIYKRCVILLKKGL